MPKANLSALLGMCDWMLVSASFFLALACLSFLQRSEVGWCMEADHGGGLREPCFFFMTRTITVSIH